MSCTDLGRSRYRVLRRDRAATKSAVVDFAEIAARWYRCGSASTGSIFSRK
ncbi:hypothetical protein NY08_1041 [Rhodococcus sp. B7740]|nr:hypothetical protein NY08_1041 [Rhodococcus sp. B7740]